MDGDELVGHHALGVRGLDVDDRRLAGDRDCFLQRADAELAIDRRGEGAGQFEALPPERREPGQRERDCIDAWPQVRDPVLAGAVADDRAGLLDERWTGGFDSDAREQRAGRIAHDP